MHNLPTKNIRCKDFYNEKPILKKQEGGVADQHPNKYNSSDPKAMACKSAKYFGRGMYIARQCRGENTHCFHIKLPVFTRTETVESTFIYKIRVPITIRKFMHQFFGVNKSMF